MTSLKRLTRRLDLLLIPLKVKIDIFLTNIGFRNRNPYCLYIRYLLMANKIEDYVEVKNFNKCIDLGNGMTIDQICKKYGYTRFQIRFNIKDGIKRLERMLNNESK